MTRIPLKSTCLAALAVGWCGAAVAETKADSIPAAVVVADQAHAGYSKQLQFAYESKGGEKRERSILLWYPTVQEEKEIKYQGQRGMAAVDAPVKEGRHPLVIFSHGFWGAADQSVFLMEALARAGYVVASVHHNDAIPNQEKTPVEMPNFLNAKAWEDDKFFDRREDMVALLDAVLERDSREDSLLHGRIDRDAIGAAGHSLGGYTVLGMAGARDSWSDDRIKAALLLSPYILPYFHNGRVEKVEVPIMFQGGTLDIGITPFLKGLYEKLGCAKYYLILKGVDHFGWTDFNSAGRTTTEALEEGFPKLIADYGVAFFDQHLRGEDRQAALPEKEEDLHAWWASTE